MADRGEIIAFADELLEIEEFDDYGPNGLQVPGAREVSRIVSGVSAHLELIERAVDAQAELLIAHHGLFWEFHPRALSEQMAARLRAALQAGLGIAAYHLPLDAHPEIGNNALLCGELGFEPDGTFAAARGRAIGVIGRAEGMPIGELEARIEDRLDRTPALLGAGPDRLERVGFVSGAGASFLGEAIALGLDAMVTGEPAEHATAEAREGGLHFIAAGHHATERAGVRRLGELIAERFGIEHEYIEVANPI